MSEIIFSFEELQETLDSYQCCKLGVAAEPSLLDIAGFPNRENVYSNILKFFLDVNEAHRFGPLFIQAILAAFQRKSRDKYPELSGVCRFNPENMFESLQVEREVRTDKGRIDILVKCSEFVLCIENKIWSGLNNDLGEYRQYCENKYTDHHVLGIVLSPLQLDSEEPILIQHKFVNITYTDLAMELQQRLGYHIDWNNTKYQYLLFDFIEKIRRFGEEKDMEKEECEFIDFWKKNETKINNIQSRYEILKRKLNTKQKAQELIDQCLNKLNSNYVEIFEPWIYASHVAVFDLKDKGDINQCGVFLHVEFYPHKISYVLGSRRGAKPFALANHINENEDYKSAKICFESHFWEDGQESDRQVFQDNNSPFNKKVRDTAVQYTVKILSTLAELKIKGN